MSLLLQFEQTLLDAGIPVRSIAEPLATTHPAPKENLTTTVGGQARFVGVDWGPGITAGQKTSAQTIATSFDWSSAAQTVRENVQARADAKLALASTVPLGKLLRSLLDLIMGAFNILRAQVVGENTLVWDAPNMANATGATSPNITVAGALFGDYVDVSASISFGGLIAFGSVSAANTVTIRLHNSTGSAVNPASATYRVLVRRQGPLPPYTFLALRNALDATIDSGTQD